MRLSRSVWRRDARVLSGLAAPVLLSLTPLAPAGEPAPLPLAGPAEVVVAPAPAAPKVFDLATARETAAANQPAVVAARDSLNAAELKAAALNKRGFSALLARDLPIRRQQAALGLTIASAAVDQACCDARQAATTTYLAALYALEQQRNADAIHNRLTDLKTLAQTALDKGRRDVSKEQVDVIDSYLDTVEGRKQEAIEGYQRALAALREALGLGPNCTIEIVGKGLPDVHTKADRDTIVQLALTRRGEVIEANTAVGVFCLEVDAQGRICFPPARTFASGADIHSMPLAPTLHDPEYRPGPIGPEMPVSLPGNKAERREIAEAYHARAGAVADKTRNLIGLEAEDAFLRWKQYDDEQPKLEAAAAKLEAHASDLSQKFNPEKVGYPTLDDILNNGLKATQFRLDATTIKFRRLAALADLERVTCDGFDAGLTAPAAPAVAPKP